MPHGPSILIAIPAHNEVESVDRVLPAVLEYGLPVLLIDDGSTDSTAARASVWPVELIRNRANMGYGRVMRDILSWTATRGFDWVITMDCDEQHEPSHIPEFVKAIRANTADVVSGSRYLKHHSDDQPAPVDRRAINQTMTSELNAALGGRLGCALTDSFCGYKAYRTSACSGLCLDSDGYEFPMQFWVQAAANRLRVTEIPVPRLYLDARRSFGGTLNDPEARLAHYRSTMARELARCQSRLARPDIANDTARRKGRRVSGTCVRG